MTKLTIHDSYWAVLSCIIDYLLYSVQAIEEWLGSAGTGLLIYNTV